MERLKTLIEKAEKLLYGIDPYDNKPLSTQICSEIKSIHVQGQLLIRKVDKFTLEEYSNLFSHQPNRYYEWNIWKSYYVIEFEKCLGILKAIVEVGKEVALDKSFTKIFISHGKFSPAFQKLESFIRAIGCLPVYDTSVPTKGKTINQHIDSIIEKVDFYIVLATSETTDILGKKLPNHNVCIEFDRIVQSRSDKMIVFLEEDCSMPSMEQDIIWVPFTENSMDIAFTKLAVELKKQYLL